MTPAQKLIRAAEKAERATKDLCHEAIDFAHSCDHGSSRDIAQATERLLAAAKKATNAKHEVGRCEKAVR